MEGKKTDVYIKVYTLNKCPNCDKLKRLLHKISATYEEVNMASPAAMTELVMNNVYTASAPVLQIDKSFYLNIDASGQIIDILKIHGLM